MSFYNTTGESGDALAKFREKANQQNDLVLEIFQAYAPYNLSPSQVHRIVEQVRPLTPLTSVRRSISTLTKAGKLAKTTEKRISDYGRPEYLWALPGGQQEMFR